MVYWVKLTSKRPMHTQPISSPHSFFNDKINTVLMSTTAATPLYDVLIWNTPLLDDLTDSCTIDKVEKMISSAVANKMLIIIIIIIIIIRNLYSAIMPLGGYIGAGGTGR